MVKRGLFQGTYNVFRFNRHFFLTGLFVVLLLLLLYGVFQSPYFLIFGLLSSVGLSLPIVATFYAYDLGTIYEVGFLKAHRFAKVALLHAGFDEYSESIVQQFPEMTLDLRDFYNSQQHTEKSIAIARRYYPIPEGTLSVTTSDLQLETGAYACIFVPFAAHEIRKEAERILFFNQLKKALSPGGVILVLEHPRNAWNALAYSIGVFHFLSQRTWKKTFQMCDFKSAYTPRNLLVREYRLTL